MKKLSKNISEPQYNLKSKTESYRQPHKVKHNI